MTWILKHTRSDRPMVAEYLCPVHGRFALEVARDANGDPPGDRQCPRLISSSPSVGDVDWSMHAYLKMPERTSHCGRPSPFAISRPGYCKVKNVEAVRGGYQKAERPTWTDTTNLGEGQDPDDWWDDRDKVWERQRESEIKELSDG